MPIADKLEAAKKIDALLKAVLAHGGFRLKYRITVPPAPEQPPEDWDQPLIHVELTGPDSPFVLARGGELLRSLEYLSLKLLRLESGEHHLVDFDCREFKAMRHQELKLAAEVAAEKVRKTGVPYQFGPMSARERRELHLFFKDSADLRTESTGEGMRRGVVVYPKDYQERKTAPSIPRLRRR